MPILTPEILKELILGTRNYETMGFSATVTNVRVWPDGESDPPGGITITLENGTMLDIQISYA